MHGIRVKLRVLPQAFTWVGCNSFVGVFDEIQIGSGSMGKCVALLNVSTLIQSTATSDTVRLGL